MLLAKGLRLGYGGNAVLDGFDLSYGPGEGAIGLRGPNGSGKSSFLKACVGLIRPMGGSLQVLGAEPGGRDFRGRLHRVGYLPQQRHLGHLRLSVRELAASGRDAARGLFRPARGEDRKAVADAMERVGILPLASRAVQELSGGQYQRALLARALATGPELILLDEPGSHLDKDSREAVIGLIREIALEGKIGIVMVSHDKALLSLCSRFAEFGNGRGELPVDGHEGDSDA